MIRASVMTTVCVLGMVVALGGAAPALAGDTGALSQLPGTQGCVRGINGSGNSKCPLSKAVGLLDASSSAVSPDGRFVYVTSPYEPDTVSGAQGGTVTVFARNPATGALTQLPNGLGCLMEAGTKPIGSGCSTAVGLLGAKTIALSPDGRNAYVASIYGSDIAVFSVNQSTGALSQLPSPAACVDDEDSSGTDCTMKAPDLHGVRWVTVSPDGKNVYASTPARDAIILFSRDPTTGAISPLPGMPCIEDYEAYVPHKCPVIGYALNYPRMLSLSPDGKNVYVASNMQGTTQAPDDGNAIAEFSRDPNTGRLTQLPGADACIKDVQAPPDTKCSQTTNGLNGEFAVKVSPDGKNAYSVADSSDAIAIFTRDQATGALHQPAGRQTCIRDALSTHGANCPLLANGLAGAEAVDISPEGKNVYVSSFYGGAIAAFRRDPATGDLTQLPGSASCVKNYSASRSENCPVTIDGINGVRAATLSPDGTSVYAPASVGGTLAVFSRDAPPFSSGSPVTAPSTTIPKPKPAPLTHTQGPIGMNIVSTLRSIGRTGRLRLRLASTEGTLFVVHGFVRAVGRPIHGTGGVRGIGSFHAVQRIANRKVVLLKPGRVLVTIKLTRAIRVRLAHTRRAHLSITVQATNAANQNTTLRAKTILRH